MRVKRQQNNLVKETKKSASAYVSLPYDTAIDVVAVTADGTEYIFEMSFGQWLKITKKPGVRYSSFQKGFAQFPNAIRTEYKN